MLPPTHNILHCYQTQANQATMQFYVHLVGMLATAASPLRRETKRRLAAVSKLTYGLFIVTWHVP